MASNPAIPAIDIEQEASENTSLLRDSEADNIELLCKKPSTLVIIAILLIYFLLLNFSDEIIVPAQMRVFESIYCKIYYEKHDPSLIGSDGGNGVAEKWCKGSVIQGEVAMLKGWQVTLDSIGMLVFSLPWGYYADIYGRKPVLLLASSAIWTKWLYIQLICYFAAPLRLTWISAMYSIMGGGQSIIGAMVYTIVSDVTPEGQRVTIFFQLMAASFITQFLGPLLSAAFMSWNPWIPMILGLFTGIIGILLISFLPETLKYNQATLPETSTSSIPPANSVGSGNSVSKWSKLLHHSRNSTSFLVSDIRIPLILLAFGPHILLLNRDILLQYISTRFKITLARATVLVSTRSGLVLFFSLFIFPAANVLFRKRLEPKHSDLALSRTSAGLYALSFLLIGLAPNFPVLILALITNALGWGLFSFLRSLLISLVEGDHIAGLNTWIGIFETLGSMFGSPILAILFKKGLELGGIWRGLPFLVCAGVLTIIGGILAGITVE